MDNNKNNQKNKSITVVIPTEAIQKNILLIRNKTVMLDFYLAGLYEIETKVLIQAVKRNLERFPEDFMFQLQSEEYANLRSQIVTSSWGGRRYPPYAFTEQGIAMLSSVLRSAKAIQVNVEIMRSFVQLRQFALNHDALRKKIIVLESKYDKQFKIIFDAIGKLLSPVAENKKQRKIGFIIDE